MKSTKKNKKVSKPKGKGKMVYVQPSKSFYRKSSDVDSHNRSASYNVKIQGHWRNSRRSKDEIKNWGTRKKPFNKKKKKKDKKKDKKRK